MKKKIKLFFFKYNGVISFSRLKNYTNRYIIQVFVFIISKVMLKQIISWKHSGPIGSSQFNAIPFFLITTMFQMGINKKITFNKHFARTYIRAYTKSTKIMFSLKKSSGPVGLNTIMLDRIEWTNNTNYIIIKPNYNYTGIFPDNLKTGKVSPLYKKG